MKKPVVDIFKLLRHIDAGDLMYYESLSDEEKKSISMFMVARWQSCTKNMNQIVMSNALVNSTVLQFGTKHSAMLYRLMLIASSGTEKQYKWVPKATRKHKRPESTDVIASYYNISKMDASEYHNMFTVADVIELANSMGKSEATIKQIKNEYK